ncbi:unnamed protein product [Nesidiocoris tenuis]|uniref:GST N-terminal domain-containing protein n=1 Tax=Nesidiocoris tenuis TaxID=355587 RepID=A0A6H5H234_9HEMI|nr:unnamed protein product [Nesidiocoris tenuis]
MMTAKVLGADLNIKILNILKKEQLTPEFIKVNPQHTIPTLNDNGFVISESRAIAAYLADSSPNGEEIYPKDIKKRARVEEMLYFDIGRLYSNFIGTYWRLLPLNPGGALISPIGHKIIILSRSII